jgi:hypothetical protein
MAGVAWAMGERRRRLRALESIGPALLKAEPLPRRRLTRLDLATDTNSLAPSLISAIETDGGLWSAGDAYTSADEVITAARHCGAVALRLDFRDLSRLSALPSVRYLHIRTDGRPSSTRRQRSRACAR